MSTCSWPYDQSSCIVNIHVFFEKIYQKKLDLKAVSFLELLSDEDGIPREVSSLELSLVQDLRAGKISI